MMSFRFSLIILFAALISLPVHAQGGRPAVSEKPYAMMQKLAMLEGTWSMVTEIKSEADGSWQAVPAQQVTIGYRHKDLMLAEIPANVNTPGFHMESYITYDQYRKVYRKAAVDDVWGVMDLYEGVLEGDTIVFTNLAAGTSFPVAEGVWRHFRLTLELKEGPRKMHIEKSDDGGKTWRPAFRVTYNRIQNKNVE